MSCNGIYCFTPNELKCKISIVVIVSFFFFVVSYSWYSLLGITNSNSKDCSRFSDFYFRQNKFIATVTLWTLANIR